MIAEGTLAPDFALPDHAGSTQRLSELRGKWVVLYFYPRDNTPLCTTQACGLRDMFPQFDTRNVVIFGISADSVQSHATFRRKYNLPFALLADVGAAVSTRYGVWKEKSLFGHRYMGIERTTFIIDPTGRVARIFPKVRVRGHADIVLKTLEELELGV